VFTWKCSEVHSSNQLTACLTDRLNGLEKDGWEVVVVCVHQVPSLGDRYETAATVVAKKRLPENAHVSASKATWSDCTVCGRPRSEHGIGAEGLRMVCPPKVWTPEAVLELPAKDRPTLADMLTLQRAGDPMVCSQCGSDILGHRTLQLAACYLNKTGKR
jgi:hypothetical protein